MLRLTDIEEEDWARHVAHLGKEANASRGLGGNLHERYLLKETGVNRRITVNGY
jgi:hypothetical protein